MLWLWLEPTDVTLMGSPGQHLLGNALKAKIPPGAKLLAMPMQSMTATQRTSP